MTLSKVDTYYKRFAYKSKQIKTYMQQKKYL